MTPNQHEIPDEVQELAPFHMRHEEHGSEMGTELRSTHIHVPEARHGSGPRTHLLRGVISPQKGESLLQSLLLLFAHAIWTAVVGSLL